MKLPSSFVEEVYKSKPHYVNVNVYNHSTKVGQLFDISIASWFLNISITFFDSLSNKPTYGVGLVLRGLGDMGIPLSWSCMKLWSVQTAITISICKFKLIWGIWSSTIFLVDFTTPNVHSTTPHNEECR